MELDTPLESGETVLRLLTTLPVAVDAARAADLYRRRWTIEGLFQRLQAVIHSEVRTLGQPRAALLAFSVAVVAYNVLAVVQAAVETQATQVAEPVPVSLYYVAHTVREHYRGLLIAVPASVWINDAAQPPAELAARLRQIAAYIRLEAYRKHPRGASGPRQKTGYAPRADVQQHVATARVLAEHKRQRRQQEP